MTRETIGVILGWILVTVAAWFAALLILGYVDGNILPWTWTSEKRAWHLGIQAVLIALYAILTRPHHGKE